MVTEALNRKVVRVPDVVGRKVDKARIVLEDAGLPKIVVLYRESYEDKNVVLEFDGLAVGFADHAGEGARQHAGFA